MISTPDRRETLQRWQHRPQDRRPSAQRAEPANNLSPQKRRRSRSWRGWADRRLGGEFAECMRFLVAVYTQVTKWVGTSGRPAMMSMQAGEVFCRLVMTLGALFELHDGNLEGALHWLTSPNMALANERPVNLLVTEAGRRAVQPAVHAIEYGLPA